MTSMPQVERMIQGERAGIDQKTDGILDRIAGTFARRGLDGASMQELAAAAGMSVGNFYRYYPSKIALITALVHRCACDVRRDFEEARQACDPMRAMRELLHRSLFEMSRDEAALWLQVDAAAVVHPEIAAVKRTMDDSIRADVVSMLRTIAGSGDPSKVEEVADFLFLFCAGLFRQRPFEDDAVFASKVRRMTAQLFDWVRAELAAETRTETLLAVTS